MKIVQSVIMMFALLSGAIVSAADNNQVLKALSSDNHFALMRHALAPGTGDPSNFAVGDCSTQRNLNDTGRQQARDIGQVLQSHTRLGVYSSQWCRCMETAALLGIGPVTALPPINSFYADRSRAGSQTEATIQWLAEATLPVILVTHQVNITALTGVYPASGEIVVVRREDDGAFTVVGSIEM